MSQITKGGPAIHFTAILGEGEVPSSSDFDACNAGAITRCQNLLALLKEDLDCLWALVEQQEKKLEAREAKERANTIPGVPPANVQDAPKGKKGRPK